MTMIEKVARAIAISEGHFEVEWANYEDAAKAAIEAMREPTDEMLLVIDCQSWDNLEGYKAMIDAALEEK